MGGSSGGRNGDAASSTVVSFSSSTGVDSTGTPSKSDALDAEESCGLNVWYTVEACTVELASMLTISRTLPVSKLTVTYDGSTKAATATLLVMFASTDGV